MPSQPPLTGLKVLEFAGLAPGPFAGLLLADAGASVLRIDRPSPSSSSPLPTPDLLTRHKSSITLNLKSPSSISFLHKLIPHIDILIDPFRPGVLEKLSLGPSLLLKLNPRLIYARLTGFRRDGKYSLMAGHDINYLSVSGVLSLLGRGDSPPHPPINILGDFAGGGAALFQGILLALLSRGKTGKGQIVEANMVDGASYLATFNRLSLKTPTHDQPRGHNLLDGGCPYYDTYLTRDNKYVAVGALEPQFFAALALGLGLESEWQTKRFDRSTWEELRGILTEKFKSKTRREWEEIFDGTDACVTPVLDYKELEERAKEGEGDQRPMVTLKETPLLAISQQQQEGKGEKENGQGPGVKGGGYKGYPLKPGEGGEETLRKWVGWQKGEQYKIGEDGGLVLLKEDNNNKSKL
ncbi:Isopenicillin N epimerase component 2 [Podospora fimiseda]|uniref:Isopenicillin N epimerase component 2 n=1 Tax=Podospora fimiseda TaxID=252190 RepID=A0AAN7H452_9PEZI|nr:Isopenicillin N epimerase component 2 [Podospora fimiseda]